MKGEIGYKAVRFLFVINIFYITVSYFWAVFTDTYNGDFLNYDVNLSTLPLFFVWTISILPFIGLRKIYKYYKGKTPPKKKVFLDMNILFFFVCGLIISHIFVSSVFGVGKALAPIYEAPPLMKLFIQIILRFDANIWGTFCIFILQKKEYRKLLLVVLLLLILGVVKAFLGIVYSIAIVLIVKYYKEVIVFARKNVVLVGVAIFLIPFFVEFIFNQRDVLRGVGKGDVQYEKNTLIAGKFVGRLSSFSNTAMILDRAPFYGVVSQQFDDFFYPKRMLATIDGERFGKDKSPEQLIKEDTPENVSFMLGTSGMLIFSLYRSFFCFFVNICSILLIIILVFEIMRKIHFELNTEFSFLLLLGPTLSGVSVEYFSAFLACIILFVTLLILRMIKKIIKNEN